MTLSDNALRVVSFNMHKGRSISGSDAKLARLAHLLGVHKTDVALMQEVAGAARHGQDHLGDLLGGELKEHLYGANVIKGNRHHGNAIFAKPGSGLNLVGNFDISAHRLESRGLLIARAEFFGRPGSLISAHLALTAAGRMRQAEWIKEKIDAMPPEEWVIMGGDFNCWGTAVQKRLESAGLSCASLGGGKTFPSVLPLAQLDKIFVKNCGVKDSGVLRKGEWRGFSDHLPIWADIEF